MWNGNSLRLYQVCSTGILNRSYLKISVLADTVLKMNSKYSFTPCKLRFFVHFFTPRAFPTGHLVSPALTNFEMLLVHKEADHVSRYWVNT